MGRDDYGSFTNRRNQSRRNGPDFGRSGRRRKQSRLPGFLIVLFLSVVLGLTAYRIADVRLNEKMKKPNKQTEVTPKPTETAVKPQPTAGLTETFAESEKYPDGVLTGFVDTRKRVKVKGIYVNTAFLGRKNGNSHYPTIDELIELCDTTELNAMVIDVKDDTGYILYNTQNERIRNAKGVSSYIADLPAFVAKLKEHGIYCIARVVTFKDMVMTKANPNMAVKNKDGSIFVDGDGSAWLNPYDESVRQYLMDIAEEVSNAGFDEIQFDYLRLSSSSKLDSADFGPIPEGMTKIDAVTEFVKYACEKLKRKGVFVSGDVFGTIINSVGDGERIGQNYVTLSRYLDYICPMTYPSHYALNYGGLKYPDKKPFQLLLMEMRSSQKKLSVIEEGYHKAEVRPWLQDFTASYLGGNSYMVYGPKEVRAQISAVYSAGYEEWLLWNAVMSFSKDGLLRDKDGL